MLLIIGCKSKIAPHIINILRKSEYFLSHKNEGFDFIIDLNNIEDVDFDIRITHAILLSSITSINFCNKHPEISRKINGSNTIRLINILNKRGIKVLFPSSTCVFSCKSKTIKDENSQTNGDTIYGKIKAEVEKKIIDNELNTILRLTKIVSPDDQLLQIWKKELINKKVITAYKDLRLAPLSVFTVAEFIKNWYQNEFNGIIHLSPSEDISYFDLAQKLCLFLSIDQSYIKPSSVFDSGKEVLYIPQIANLQCKNKFSKSLLLDNELERIFKSL